MRAFELGTAENWLINFFKELRDLLPNHVIAASVRPCLCRGLTSFYPNGAYRKVNQEAGHLIDYYVVEYYNEGNTIYDSYEKLFINSQN